MTFTDVSGAAATAASRRAELGAASARSLLLTVLGEFVFPRGQQVWTATLIKALGALDIEEKSARQAISRAAAEGLLSSSREGRRVRWSLTEDGESLLREGSSRIYSFLASEHEWDGQWLLLSVAVPESQRKLRHRLRTQLTWLGMGSPSPGLWVVPDAQKTDDVSEVLESLSLCPNAFVWTGQWVEIGEREALISAAWALDEVAESYRAFIETFDPTTDVAPAAQFAAQVHLVQAWRRFPFLDPDLPAVLLPADWPGQQAAAAFHACHARWHDAAQETWEQWEADAV